MSYPELQLPNYYEQPSVLHVNTEANRSYYIPFAPDDKAFGLTEGPTESSRFRSLNGRWDFRLYDNPFVIEDFMAGGYTYENFSTIQVPGCLQTQGYGIHQYTNVNFPFPYDPPYVPHENPSGVYHRTFVLAGEASEYEQYLNFEGVDSCFYLYLNHQLVGYSQVSHSTSEFCITPYITTGVNHIHVIVLKWCDGSYLEDQDKFRMSGIFRDVYLLARPKQHIRDFFVRAMPDDTAITDQGNTADATVSVELEFAGAAIPVEYVLTDAAAAVVATGFANGSKIEIQLDKASLWNAERPYLYRLELRTGNEVITQEVGIRKIEVKDGIVLLNGIPIKFKGVNRHDSDPVTGYTISREQALRDLRLMKEHNINAIRTSHYPNAPWFPQLCSRYGFYVVGEADLEAHGAVAFYGGGYKTTYGDLVQREIFYDAVLDRNQRNVQRDKNNPSIVMWSMGNEAGYSRAFEDTGRWIHSYDETRLVHYEGVVHQTGGHINDDSMLDVHSTMYDPIASIEQYMADPDKTKPYMLCEYIHAMGNGPGDIEDYLRCIYSHPRFCGGFVWEWCDHAIDMGKTVDGKKIFYYGGDSGEFPHDGNFCVDGMVSPDRIPHPALLEYKNGIRPVRAVLIDGAAGTVELENKLDFTDLAELLEIEYQLMYDGETIETGKLALPVIAPHEKKTLTLGTDYQQNPSTYEQGSVHLLLTYIQKQAGIFTAAGHILGFDQLTLQDQQRLRKTAAASEENGNLEVTETATRIVVESPVFRYVYNKLRGNFDSLTAHQMPLITRPAEYNIWRAPIDNDKREMNEWLAAGYNRAGIRTYQTAVEQSRDGVTIHTKLAVNAIQIQHILDAEVTWNIDGNGQIRMNFEGKRNMAMPFLPRLGLRLFVPKEFEQVTYLGYGPGESYIDKHLATYFGKFSSRVSDMYVDYIRPQENSSHYGCRYITLEDTQGNNIHVTGAEPFSFQATRFTQEQLAAKKHNYELVPADETILCIDYKMSGVGSAACGPSLAEQYQLREEDIQWQIELLFAKNN